MENTFYVIADLRWGEAQGHETLIAKDFTVNRVTRHSPEWSLIGNKVKAEMLGVENPFSHRSYDSLWVYWPDAPEYKYMSLHKCHLVYKPAQTLILAYCDYMNSHRVDTGWPLSVRELANRLNAESGYLGEDSLERKAE